MIIRFVLLTLVFLFPGHAYAQESKSLYQSFVEFFFGPEKEEPRPEDTLIAPFAAQSANKAAAQNGLEWNPEGGQDDTKTDLSLRHRTVQQIADWLEISMTEAYTFDSSDLQGQIRNNFRHFSKTGEGQYVAHLKNSGALQALQSGQFTVSSFVENTPFLLNTAVADGRYKWLFDVPITMTIAPVGMASYQDLEGNAEMLRNARFIIQTQVARFPKADNEHDVQIELITPREAN